MRILLASPIDPKAVRSLRRSHDVHQLSTTEPGELARAAADREAVVLRSGVVLSSDIMTAAPDLKLVVRAGSGLDNIDVDHARRRGIRVVRVAGMSAPPVAEFTFALLLSLARKVTVADRLIRIGEWPKPQLGGALLRGKVLGVVGAGNIGGLVGEMGSAWGMNVLGCVAHPDGRVATELAHRGITLTDFDDVVDRADFLTLHVPLDESTHHMIDGTVLDRMRPGSLLVNVARGGVVDEKALYDALTEGISVAGAALDVHESEGEGTVSPLAELPNVVLTPHIGAMALDSQRLIGERVTELIEAFHQGTLNEEVRDGEHVV
ncbi:MAG TPA: NAD(P)-dependent oxidoreductase [Nocardioidaceae bacterium]|jgi:phosphoglycerate dehydrogenase-like enzyme|nr:NAD(P)-dependent oxidoreductase [Nocardioidaceae bacterium]